MTKHQLHPLSLRSLSLSELLQLGADTVKEVKGFLKLNSKEVLLIKQCQELEASLGNLKQAQESLKPTGLSGLLEKADLARDQSFRTLRAFVKAYALIQSEATQEAYLKLLALLDLHREVVRRSYEVQSQQTRKLLEALKSSDYQRAVNQLNLGSQVTALETAQATFEQVYKERVSEQASLTPGQLKNHRKTLEDNYRLLAELVLLTTKIYGNSTNYQDLLKRINALRTRYRKTKKKRIDSKNDD